jgi:hypothetical protein
MNRSDLRAVLFGLILIILMMVGKSVRGQITPSYVKGFGIKHEKIVHAQMMLESGNLECTDCSWSNYNNAFGFHNGKRYLRYDNLEHCLEGYKQWQEWRCPDTETDEEYCDCLVKYWGAPDMVGYINKLKAILK